MNLITCPKCGRRACYGLTKTVHDIAYGRCQFCSYVGQWSERSTPLADKRENTVITNAAEAKAFLLQKTEQTA